MIINQDPIFVISKLWYDDLKWLIIFEVVGAKKVSVLFWIQVSWLHETLILLSSFNIILTKFQADEWFVFFVSFFLINLFILNYLIKFFNCF